MTDQGRKNMRGIVSAFISLAILALLFWMTDLLKALPVQIATLARLLIGILALDQIFTGAENVTRAIKLTGPAGTSLQFGPDAPAAAQKVADSAQQTADVVKEQTQ